MNKTVSKDEKSFLDTVRFIFGFNRHPHYIEERLKQADIRSAIFLSAVVALVEIWMIIRYIATYVIEKQKCDSIEEFFQYTNSYWIILGACIAIFIYSLFYLAGKLKATAKLSRILIFMFFALGIYFGITVSQNDFSRGRMVTCFLTMLMWSTVICVWRPFASVLLTVLLGGGFLYYINNYTADRRGNPIIMSEGDTINFITFLIIITILQLAVYFQRYSDASNSYKLEQASVTDELTGIPNMRRFDSETKSYLAKSAEEGKHLIFLVFDIRNFHTFNDRFGYPGGDELLKKVGQIIVDEFSGEPAARESGDHFCVLTSFEGHTERAARIREKIRAVYPDESYLDIKVGTCRPEDTTKDIRHAVDRALYALKQIKHGDDEFIREYDEKMQKEHSLKQFVLNNVERAVKEGHIKVYFQPVMWAKDGTICGCEALARWIDPDMGFMSPGVFIPVLEEGRQIHKLDLCIYEQVCRRIRECLDNGLPALPTSMNFSRLDFELMDAVGELEKLVQKYDIPKEYLHVEITESAVTNDFEGLKTAMKRLHDSGYVIWLDDFGSGYSSLNVLKDLDFDLLKIDMEFLKNFSTRTNAPKIVGTIIELAEKLNMKTLAEGVETQETVDFLREAGCGRLQGYYYGKPMPYEDILAKINDGTYIVGSIEE